MKHKLIVMIGIPGSGKSTAALRLKKEYEEKGLTVTYVSRDTIRFAMIDNIDSESKYFSKETEVYTEFIKEIKEGLADTDITIADATHYGVSSRTKLFRNLGPALKDIEIIAYVLDVSLETALKQNDNRTGITHVPVGAITNLYHLLTIPTEEEGFNSVCIERRRNE